MEGQDVAISWMLVICLRNDTFSMFACDVEMNFDLMVGEQTNNC